MTLPIQDSGDTEPPKLFGMPIKVDPSLPSSGNIVKFKHPNGHEQTFNMATADEVIDATPTNQEKGQ